MEGIASGPTGAFDKADQPESNFIPSAEGEDQVLALHQQPVKSAHLWKTCSPDEHLEDYGTDNDGRAWNVSQPCSSSEVVQELHRLGHIPCLAVIVAAAPTVCLSGWHVIHE